MLGEDLADDPGARPPQPVNRLAIHLTDSSPDLDGLVTTQAEGGPCGGNVPALVRP